MTGRRWTDAEDDAIALVMSGHKVTQHQVKNLATTLGRTYLAVQRRALKLNCEGIARHHGISMRELIRSGYTRSRICVAMERLGITGRRTTFLSGRPRSITFTKAESDRILKECATVPDGGMLNASKHGEWGRRGKYRVNPTHCITCGTNARPHYCLGKCHRCYKAKWRAAKMLTCSESVVA